MLAWNQDLQGTQVGTWFFYVITWNDIEGALLCYSLFSLSALSAGLYDTM